MKLITVVPITKGFFKENLTYFTAHDVEPGAIVSAPLKNKIVPSLVVSVEPIENKKTNLKQSAFGLRKAHGVISKRFFTPQFIEAAKASATYFSAPIGQVIKSFVPKAIIEEKGISASVAFHSSTTRYERIVVQSSDEERMAYYKSFIREEFAKKHSIFFCLPTLVDIEEALPHLEKGIEEYTFVFHAGLSSKKLIELWKRVSGEDHPVLIVATPSFLSLPRTDLGAYILDREASPYYKSSNRPFVDARFFTDALAKAVGTKLIVGDIMLRVETIYEHEKGSYVTPLPLKFRSLATAQSMLASMREETENKNQGLATFSKQLVASMVETIEAHGNIFLYSHRKGFASMTVCSDCGTYVACERCRAPVVLHSSDEGNFFLCHKCWKEKSTEIPCAHCSGWRLQPLGIGIERVREETERLFPGKSVFCIDGDSVSSHKRATEIAEAFYASPGGILIGTDMAVPYLFRKVETVGLISLDSLFSVPDFRIHEKIFHTCLVLRQKAGKRFVLQTRTPERRLFEYAVRGNLVDFYRDELIIRQKFNYPPYRVLIKITLEGDEQYVSQSLGTLQERCERWKPAVFPAFSVGPKGEERMHALIRIPPETWPDPALLEILASLPPEFIVNVDPEDIL